MLGLIRAKTHHAKVADMALMDLRDRLLQQAKVATARYERDLALERVERALMVCGASKGTTVGKRAIEDALALVPTPAWVKEKTADEGSVAS